MNGAIQVMELISDEKLEYPFCNYVCSKVISGFCRMGRPELAFGFFENYVKVGALKFNLVAYTTVVSSLCMLGRVDEVSDMVCEIEKERLAFDVVFYSCLICGYFWNGFFMEAICKHKEMVEKGINDDNISYTVLIDGFSKEGYVEKVVGFLHKMIASGFRPSLVTYTVIVSGFCRKGKVDEAFAVFRMVKNLGIDLDEFVYAVLVDGFCLKGDFDRAYQLMAELEKKGIGPGIVAHNILMNRLCKSGKTSDADEISKVIQGDNITYSTLLHGYIKEQNSVGILEVKRRSEEAGIHMDIVMCNVILKALFAVGAFEDVHVFYKGMKKMNLVANSITYCTLIDGYGKAGRIDEALEVFDEFRHALGSSAACYDCMVNGLIKNGLLDMAVEVLVELHEKGLTFDVTSHMAVMKAITEDGSVDGILKLIYRIENLGHDNATLWNAAIKILSKRKFWMAALEVYLVARRKKLILTSMSYYLVIKGLINNGKFRLVQPILSNFVKECGLNESKLSKILMHYLCLKDVNSALYFLDKMKKDKEFMNFPIGALRALEKHGNVLDAYKIMMGARDDLPVMDVVDYSIMVDGLCKAGHPIKALDLCIIAEEKGITLNIVTYNSVINGLCKQGCFVEAFRLFDSLEKIELIPSEITYSILIDNLCKEGYFLDAKQIFERMKLKGYKSCMRIYNSFINGYCKFGQFEEALKILKTIETECLNLDEFTVSFMINCFCRKGDMEGALRFFDEYKQKGSFPDFLGYLYLMRGLCAKGRMEEARGILREMLQSESVMELLNRVSSEFELDSVESFLVFLCEQGSIKEAITLLDEVGYMFFAAQKWCGFSASQELQQPDESDALSTVSSIRITGSGLALPDVVQADDMVERSDVLRETEFDCFESYYSEIASLCLRGELGAANRLAKEKLAVLEGTC